MDIFCTFEQRNTFFHSILYGWPGQKFRLEIVNIAILHKIIEAIRLESRSETSEISNAMRQ